MKKLLSRPKADKPDQVHHLGASQPFLLAIRDACLKGERYTLTAESGSDRWVVLVDRGGPANVTGGGTTGSPALRTAAALTEGTYRVATGWPVAQPLYQIGLEDTLVELLGGQSAARQLPRPRGVDTMRDGGAAEVPAFHDALTMPPLPPLPASSLGPLGVSAPTPSPALTAPPTPVGPTLPTPAPTAMAPTPTPAFTAPIVDAPIVAAAITAPPVAAAAVAPPPASAPPPTPQVMSAERELLASLAPAMSAAGPSPMRTGEPGTSQKQGPFKHLLTQALLWIVNVDEPDRYVLAQAWLMAREATAAGTRELWLDFTSLFQRQVGMRVRGIKTDWDKSGEVTRKGHAPGSKR